MPDDDYTINFAKLAAGAIRHELHGDLKQRLDDQGRAAFRQAADAVEEHGASLLVVDASIPGPRLVMLLADHLRSIANDL
jgi:hypothetical protein